MSTDDRPRQQEKSTKLPGKTDHVFRRCPICGGELQATLEDYAKQVVLSSSGRLVEYEDAGCGDVRIYCENDHTEHDIRQALGIE